VFCYNLFSARNFRKVLLNFLYVFFLFEKKEKKQVVFFLLLYFLNCCRFFLLFYIFHFFLHYLYFLLFFFLFLFLQLVFSVEKNIEYFLNENLGVRFRSWPDFLNVNKPLNMACRGEPHFQQTKPQDVSRSSIWRDARTLFSVVNLISI